MFKIKKIHPWQWSIISLMGGILLLAASPAFPADSTYIKIGSPAGYPPIGSYFTVAVEMDVGATPLGGYDLYLNYNPTALEISALDGGATPAFSAKPYLDSRYISEGALRFGAIQGQSFTGPIDSLHVARATFRAIGNPRTTAVLNLTGNLIIDVDRVPKPNSSVDGIVYLGNYLGDVNSDDSTNSITDVVYYINHLLNLQDLTAYELPASDVNQDSLPATLADIIFMINIMLGSQPAMLAGIDIKAPAEDVLQRVTANAEISMPPLVFDENGEAILPLFLKTDTEIGGIFLSFGYIPGNIAVEDIALNEYGNQMTLMHHNLEREHRVVLVNFAGKRISAGEGILLTIQLKKITSGTVTADDFTLNIASLSDDRGNFVAVNQVITAIQEPLASTLPKVFALAQNYPNPFNPFTTIRYAIPVAGGDREPSRNQTSVRLQIFNVRGQRVRTLVDETQGPGFYNVVWNGLNDARLPVASGMYFYRLETPDFGIKTRKLIYLK